MRSERNKPTKPTCFRATDATKQQILELMSRWGETRTGAIVRAIERAWTMEFASKRRTRK